MWDTLRFPDPATTAQYHERGWWRDETFVDDLAAAVARHPDRPAVIAYRGGRLDQTLTWAQTDAMVTRFGAALTELGVGRDDVVVLYLPNWWMVLPLVLACGRIGAVVLPFAPAFAGRELGQALRVSNAKVCVSADEYDGVDMSGALAEVAPETLTHRVVVGDAARTGAVDFTEFFVDTPWESRHDLSAIVPRRADEVGLLLTTSGTTGQPKCIAHTPNTLYAAVRAVTLPYHLGGDEVITVPHYLTHMAGCTYSVHMTIRLGGTCVMRDDRDMGLLLDSVEEHGVTFIYAAPMFVQNMVAAQEKEPRDVSSLGTLVSGSAPIPPSRIASTREVLGVEMYALWGMTENGGVTVTRPDDPPGWAAHSDGRAEPWMETRVMIDPDDVSEPGEQPFGRLLVRGASQCMGYLNVPEVYAACLDGDGWFDTGDMAREDGRGGIRITGRRNDLITRENALKVPTLEVEGVLMRHPAVADVVLIGYPNPNVAGSELVAAFVVPDGDAPTLEQVRAFLDDQKMSRYNWPDRLELAADLPKNSLGKVQRDILRAKIDGAAEIDGEAAPDPGDR